MASVSAWEILTAATGVAVAVFATYGAIVLRNYRTVNTLEQRLLGMNKAEEGFIEETKGRMDHLENRVEHHANVTHSQLHTVDRKIEHVADLVIKSHNGELEEEPEAQQLRDLDAVPPPPRDIFEEDGAERQPDGGHPADQGQDPRSATDDD